jgi:hypothetical protein
VTGLEGLVGGLCGGAVVVLLPAGWCTHLAAGLEAKGDIERSQNGRSRWDESASSRVFLLLDPH